MEHHFNVEFAQLYGIEEAIIVHNLYFWIVKNIANNAHNYNGRYWTYNSNNALAALFPYINKTKICRVMAHLESENIILKDNFNKDSRDRTLWYSFSDEGIKVLNNCGYNIFKMTKCMVQNELCKIQNEPPLPYNKQTDIKQKEEKDKSFSKKANNSTWRADIEVYRKEVENAKEQLINDTEFKANFMNMYPNADYLRSIMKSMQYWTSEKAWELKKKGKSSKINMLATLKNNLEKSVVYKNNQDEPIENLRMLNVEYKDKKEGTLADGTFIKGAYRYYFSYREKRALSIPINAPMMPSERCEYDYNSKNWYLPRESETINDLLW